MTAQGADRSKLVVPAPVEQKFVLEHPDARASWRTEGDHFRAQFINPLNNLGQVTVYASNGTIIRKEREMDPDEVPGPVNEYLVTRSKGQGFSVWLVTDSAGTQSYYSPRPEGMVRFDKDGKAVGDKPVRDSLVPASLR